MGTHTRPMALPRVAPIVLPPLLSPAGNECDRHEETQQYVEPASAPRVTQFQELVQNPALQKTTGLPCFALEI